MKRKPLRKIIFAHLVLVRNTGNYLQLSEMQRFSVTEWENLAANKDSTVWSLPAVSNWWPTSVNQCSAKLMIILCQQLLARQTSMLFNQTALVHKKFISISDISSLEVIICTDFSTFPTFLGVSNFKLELQLRCFYTIYVELVPQAETEE